VVAGLASPSVGLDEPALAGHALAETVMNTTKSARRMIARRREAALNGRSVARSCASVCPLPSKALILARREFPRLDESTSSGFSRTFSYGLNVFAHPKSCERSAGGYAAKSLPVRSLTCDSWSGWCLANARSSWQVTQCARCGEVRRRASTHGGSPEFAAHGRCEASDMQVAGRLSLDHSDRKTTHRETVLLSRSTNGQPTPESVLTPVDPT
jgi:hypothetical protein